MSEQAQTEHEMRSIRLSSEEWQALDELARETGSISSYGTNFGQPSWRILLRRIARADQGALAELVRKGASQSEAGGGA